MTRTLLSLVTGTAIPGYAHHAFAAYYHGSQSISLEGTVHEFRLRRGDVVVVTGSHGRR